MRSYLWMTLLVGCSNGLTGTLTHADPGGDGGDASRYHPPGFDEPLAHGQELKLQVQDCRTCHGDGLDGGSSGVACDDCHEPGWQTDCLMCHGGVQRSDGSPPEGIDDTLSDDALAFLSHDVHLDGTTHVAVPCEGCHNVPDSAITPGHIFDTTPAVAEVGMQGSLSPSAEWSGIACTNLYCHSNGRNERGRVQAGAAPRECGDCHASAALGSDWLTMSLSHAPHLVVAIGCAKCHADTAASNNEIANGSLHVNGVVDVRLDAGGISMSDRGTCTGLCHLKFHFASSW